MDKQRRRDAIRDYKERKAASGIYAVRCAPTGEVWVGASRNLDAQQNGTWFTLRLGSHPNKVLQAAWAAHGEDAFSFEALERIDDKELTPLGRDDRLKSRTPLAGGARGAEGDGLRPRERAPARARSW